MATPKGGKKDEMSELLEGLAQSNEKQVAFKKKLQENIQGANLQVNEFLTEAREKVAQARSAVDIDAISNATQDSVLANKAAVEKTMAGAMSSLRQLLDSVGIGFEDVRDFSPEELGWVESSKSEKASAEAELARINATPNNWWTRLWGRVGKVESAISALKQAEAGIETAATRAKAHYEQRLDKANLEESLQRMITLVTLITNFIEEKMTDTNVELANVEQSQKDALTLKEKAAVKIKEIDEALKTLADKLKAKVDAANELTPGTPEHTALQADLESLNNENVDLRGRLEVARAIFNSNERFIELHGVAIEALTTQKANLTADLAALKSDTRHREAFYAATIRSLKMAAMQKVTSQVEEVGVHTDTKSATMLASAAVGSERARLERVEAQKGRMEDLFKINETYVQRRREFVERDAAVLRDMNERYGLEIDPNYILGFDGTGNGAPKPDGRASAPQKGDASKELEDIMK